MHDEAFEHLKRLRSPAGHPVLDLGAGTGAWTDRLLRHGFQDVVALDLNRTQFLGAARFVEGDLNRDFSRQFNGTKHGLITAVEVIEHLENPSHFFRECASLLALDGALFVTSPNIESMPSRIKFLVSGRLRHFDHQGDRTHLTPMDAFLLARLAARAGLSICDRAPLVRHWHDRRLLFRAVAAAAAPFAGGVPYGACNLFVLRHTGASCVPKPPHHV